MKQSNEIEKYLQRNILKQIQAIQTTLLFDSYVYIHVDVSYRGFTVSVFIKTGDNLFEVRCLKQFGFYSFLSKKELDKNLRGVRHFITNWKRRLGEYDG